MHQISRSFLSHCHPWCDWCNNPSSTVPNIQPSFWRNPVIRDLELASNTKSSHISTEPEIWTRSHSQVHNEDYCSGYISHYVYRSVSIVYTYVELLYWFVCCVFTFSTKQVALFPLLRESTDGFNLSVSLSHSRVQRGKCASLIPCCGWRKIYVFPHVAHLNCNSIAGLL